VYIVIIIINQGHWYCHCSYIITITIEICIAPLTKWTVALNNVNMAVKQKLRVNER